MERAWAEVDEGVGEDEARRDGRLPIQAAEFGRHMQRQKRQHPTRNRPPSLTPVTIHSSLLSLLLLLLLVSAAECRSNN